MKQEQPEFYILIGIPASGKSEWVKQALETDKIFVICSTDDIIEKEAEKTGKTYTELWKSMIDKATKIFEKTFKEAIKNKDNIIIDRTNIYKNKRKALLDQLPEEYYKIAVYFDTPYHIQQHRLKERAKATGKDIPKNVIDKMIKDLEVPTPDEGYDEILIAYASDKNEIVK